MPQAPRDLTAFQREWHGYYTEKRIGQQWMQVHLLKDLPVRRVLEIGPHLGLVTALLCNAGYQTITLDVEDRIAAGSGSPPVERLEGDVRALDSAALAGRRFDAILCCETLEHLPYGEVEGVIARLAATGAPYLVLSLPYMGSQLTLQLYLNRYVARAHTALKKFMGLKRFPRPAAAAGWQAHKWELGYRDYPLAAFRTLLDRHYRMKRTEFTDRCRSVFFLCENLSPRASA